MGANAQTSVPAFTAGQVLTAAQMTQVNTGIPVFASSTERDAAFGGTGEKTLAEGQYAFLEDTNETLVYDGSTWGAIAGGKILQVVSTFLDVAFSTSSTSFVDATGHSVTITPSSATSKILVFYDAYIFHATAGGTREINLVRDSTTINQPSSGVNPASAQTYLNAYNNGRTGFHYLDSPATTSAVTYKIQVKTDRGAVVIGSDASNVLRTPINFTVMEVSA